MNQVDELVVEIIRGAARDPADYSRDDPIGNLACDYENGRDYGGLEVVVRTDQFRELLDFRDEFVQRSRGRAS